MSPHVGGESPLNLASLDFSLLAVPASLPSFPQASLSSPGLSPAKAIKAFIPTSKLSPNPCPKVPSLPFLATCPALSSAYGLLTPIMLPSPFQPVFLVSLPGLVWTWHWTIGSSILKWALPYHFIWLLHWWVLLPYRGCTFLGGMEQLQFPLQPHGAQGRTEPLLVFKTIKPSWPMPGCGSGPDTGSHPPRWGPP